MPRRRPSAEIESAPPPAPAAGGDAGASKSELKRRMHALQELGEDVAALPADRLQALAIDDRLREAIAELARTRSHEGRRRQLQYIGKLMKFEDEAPLREAVAAFRLGSARDTLALHEAETWRDRLLAGDPALEEWLRAHPDTDAQQLRSLLRAARKEGLEEGARRGRSYRELFQLVRHHLAAEAGPAGAAGSLDARPSDR